MEDLINQLRNYSIDPNNIPIELVKELNRLKREINNCKPIFIDSNSNNVMNNWDKFKYTGLSNIDYINSNFYLNE